MLIVSIGCLLIILLIAWSISNVYKEGFANTCTSKTVATTADMKCKDNEYLSQIKREKDSTGVEQFTFTCCTDTSTLMQGLKGAEGATGPQGENKTDGAKGKLGLKGDDGKTGATGERGAQGAKGPTGATGDKGLTGPAGDTGPQGDKGMLESTGKVSGDPIPGPKGATGVAGPRGPAGPQGDDAPAAPPSSTAKAGTATSSAASTKNEPRTRSEKLKEIQLQLIKAIAARPPPVTQHVIIDTDEMDDDGMEEIDVTEHIDFTPSEAQGSEYNFHTYKHPTYYY